MTRLPSWGKAQASGLPLTAPHHVVVMVDGSDPDSYAAALAATSDVFGLNVVAGTMTGRPANPDHSAQPYEADAVASQAVLHGNAVRLNELFIRHGRINIPVFKCGIAPYSTITHKEHIDEHVLDVEPPLPDTHLAGGIEEAVAFIEQLPGTVHLISCGPLTDVALLMKKPKLRAKLGILTAQLGMFGGGDATSMAGGWRQFNVLADPDATREVLADYPGPVYVVPTGITKRSEFAFSNPADLATLATSPAFKQYVKMCERAWPIMWEPRDEKIYVHDLHAVEVMALLLDPAESRHPAFSSGHRDLGRYTFSRVGIGHVPSPGPTNDRSEEHRWGEIDLARAFDPEGPLRYLATGVDADPVLHRKIVARALNAPAAHHHSPGSRLACNTGPSINNPRNVRHSGRRHNPDQGRLRP